jgi:putative DNA methylase
MTRTLSKRLIEEIIPLTEIGVESSKSVSYGDIHSIHTWFARRPLAACRAATFASLVDAPGTEAERDKLLKLIIDSLPRKASQKKPKVFDKMRKLIRQTFDGKPPRVLDPFAGGGSLALEAARLGCETYAQDLNPNAVLTLLGTVDYPMRFAKTKFPLPERIEDVFALTEVEQRSGNLVQAVEEWGNWVLARVKPKLEPYYKDENGHTIMAHFLYWSSNSKYGIAQR